MHKKGVEVEFNEKESTSKEKTIQKHPLNSFKIFSRRYTTN